MCDCARLLSLFNCMQSSRTLHLQPALKPLRAAFDACNAGVALENTLLGMYRKCTNVHAELPQYISDGFIKQCHPLFS